MSQQIIYKIICTQDCSSPFGPMSYNWKLKRREYEPDAEWSDIEDLTNLTKGGKLKINI